MTPDLSDFFCGKSLPEEIKYRGILYVTPADDRDAGGRRACMRALICD